MHSDYPPSFPPFPHFPFPISPLSSLQVPYVGSFWFGLRPSAFRHFLLFSWVRSPPLEPGGLTDGCLTDAVDLSITLNCEYCELELYPLSYIARVSPPAIFLANGSLKTDFHLCHPECPQTHGLQWSSSLSLSVAAAPGACRQAQTDGGSILSICLFVLIPSSSYT